MANGGLSNEALVLMILDIIRVHRLRITCCLLAYGLLGDGEDLAGRRVRRRFSHTERIPTQVDRLTRLLGLNDQECIDSLRMDRNCFGRLCILLRERGGLVDGKYIMVEEQVAMFLSVLAHHKKNRVVRFEFWRSAQTVSHYVHAVLKAVIMLHELFLAKPVPVDEHCQDARWKWFPGCLGALDGTYINVLVDSEDKPRFRSRKGQIATNTMAVCTRDMRFVYVLAGWEGSAGDARVLRDAVTREHGLKVPRGQYYLCDNGYANSEGFLTPFKGVRYHLKEWGPHAMMPHNPREMYNMRHTKARNVIERAFAVVKMRWGILRSASYYPINTQVELILSCFLLHNFIRGQMTVDPIELELDGHHIGMGLQEEVPEENVYVDTIEATPAWNNKRDQLAEAMWLHEG
ncbi:uncharacterized protein LOC121803712 [Salvia splendens]|uniref:uncharacterized protein LOC121803712 n=1 Tax=Salvia splendens TaxID=180675 RepID=UPI001C258CDB|nr:uncharacterized protein LOC121803712 [Salvia splendens]XP_042059282.1 uncharacterized protein LOC121803712 [Salvia splendens]